MSGPQESLNQLVDESIRRKGLSRLLTLKAMAELGNDWHRSSDVMNLLSRNKVHNNYIFELGRRFPALVEVLPSENKVRIRTGAYHLIASKIDSCIKEVERRIRA